MLVSSVPTSALLVFGLGMAAGVAFFVCFVLLTRRLNIPWRAHSTGRSVDAQGMARLTKLIWGVGGPVPAEVAGLLWAVRLLWLVIALSVLIFAYLLTKAA